MSFFDGELNKETEAMIITDIIQETVAEYGLKKEPKSDSLADHLDVYTKDSLLQLAEENGVEVFKSWNKAKLVEHIQASVLETLDERLLLLGEAQLGLILQMDAAAETDQETLATEQLSFYITVFPIAIRYGLLFANHEGDQATIYVPAEVKDRIQTVLADYSAIAEEHAETVEKLEILETVLVAGVQLYGSLTIERIFELLEIYNPEAEMKEFATKYLPLLVIRNMFYFVDGEIIANPRFVSEDHVRDNHNYVADKMAGDFYKPSQDEIDYYAEHAFDYESPLYERMEQLMSKNSEQAVLAMNYIEMSIVMGEPFSSLVDEMKEQELLTFDNENDVVDFAHLYQQLNNTTRLWDNAGYKPSEMADSESESDFYGEDLAEVIDSVELQEETAPIEVTEKVEAVEIQKEEPVQAPRPQVRARRQPMNNGPKEPIRVEKIGRNEPCPCGSGKKYKKCHWLIDRQ